ncbi:class I SAM-dependent methyltransferase [Actinophytocola sp.]|uniref:class I SAM-dependent methyltransferase n=1 Tax=Actinophytocola sp. TaxID=1872138 RepID=UPI002D6FE7D5|nr:class I SAM-dependent methyltransferase [Actinophytocola sp.]HYQ65084.1 class I SAM-dependent methyltransferase [Actinophytocola sp.]
MALTTLAQAHRLSGETDKALRYAERAVAASDNLHGTQARSDALAEYARLSQVPRRKSGAGHRWVAGPTTVEPSHLSPSPGLLPRASFLPLATSCRTDVEKTWAKRGRVHPAVATFVQATPVPPRHAGTVRINGEQLDGVSATTLWTLRNRAVEARRPDAVLDDLWAVRLYEAISYDYERFGAPSQTHPLRALALDRAITGYLATHPKATVIALGEGLQTTYWRLANPTVDWLSVDLAAVVRLREALLPAEPRVTTLAMSALDRAWLDHVDPANGVFISAEGLFMYLDRTEVLSLIADCAERFPGGQLFFDSLPKWFSERTLRGYRLTDRYTAPPMPFSLTVSEAARLPRELPAVAGVRELPLPYGRGVWKSRSFRAVMNLPVVRDRRPMLTLLSFARPGVRDRGLVD